MIKVAYTLFFAAAVSASASARAHEVTQSRYVMGTMLVITASGSNPEQLRRGVESAFNEVDRWDGLLSTYKPASELNRINGSGTDGVEVSTATFEAVRAAVEWARKTNGAFDPTVGALVKAYDLETDSPRVPGTAELHAARLAVGWSDVFLDRDKSFIRFKRSGMALDLGGIGKGWALERALSRLRSVKMESARLDFGGQLLFYSVAKDPERPQAVIAHPEDDRAVWTRFFAPANGSLATSSASERKLPDGRGHVLDPRSGEPAGSCVSATVWAGSPVDADALSTAVFVLGAQEGLRLAERSGAAAYVIVRNADGRLEGKASPRWTSLMEGRR